MQVFELYFNPKNERKVLESFQHKPKDAYEGKIGRLYMVGEVSDPEKKDLPLLQNIFHLAKERYYKDTSLSPEQALKATLKEVNSFIRERGCAGKIDIALISSKNFLVLLGKIGRIKIFLFNKGLLRDIGEELENTGSNLFSNMVSGKMEKKDKLIVLTSEVYNFFKKGKVLETLAEETLAEGVLEKISSLQKEKFPETSGIALVMDHAVSLKEKETVIISKERKERFSFKKIFFEAVASSLKIPKIRIKKPEIKIKKPSFKRKSLLLPLLLLGVVLLGSLAIGIENNIRWNRQKEEIVAIMEKISAGRDENNPHLIEEAFSELETMIQEKTRFRQEIMEIYFSVEEELLSLSKGEKVEDLLFLGKIEKTDPDKIIFTDGKIYLFSSRSPVMSILDAASGREASYTLPVDEGVNFSSFSSKKIILFSLPNNIVLIEDEKISTVEVDLLSENEEFVYLASFLGRPYFLSSKGEVVRYSEKTPFLWIKEKERKTENGISLAIDGSIFILTSENAVYRYHEGEEKETLTPFIFPSLSSATKIYTSAETPLFILDADKERIVVLDKEGNVIKQLFNDSFTNLKDIAIANNGKKIYLLINKEVYSLEL